jgi:thioredoxin-like negative regulator of GroEL
MGSFLLLGLALASALVWYTLDPWDWRSGPPLDAARFHLQKAQEALEDRDLEPARTHLQHCLEAAPLSAEAHFLLAQTYRRLDDPAGWSMHLRKAGILGWPLNQIQMELRLKEAQTGNTWNIEEELIDELNSKTPQQALILEALVKGYLENDRAKDAYRLSDEWVRDHPGDWQARLYRARASQLGVYFPQAITDYQYVLQVKPDQPQAQLWLAQTFVSDRQYPQALEHFQTHLHNHPDAADAMLGLANCQFSMGQVEAAQATLDQLLAKNKDYTRACCCGRNWSKRSLLRKRCRGSGAPWPARPTIPRFFNPWS